MRKKPHVVSPEHLGKWIVWDRQATKIIASGKTLAEVKHAARATGERLPRFEKIPRRLFVARGPLRIDGRPQHVVVKE